MTDLRDQPGSSAEPFGISHAGELKHLQDLDGSALGLVRVVRRTVYIAGYSMMQAASLAGRLPPFYGQVRHRLASKLATVLRAHASLCAWNSLSPGT